MKKLFINLTAAVITLFGASALLLPMQSAPAYAAPSADNNICNDASVPQSVKDAYGRCPDSNKGEQDDFTSALQNILNGIIAALGIVAVIVIVIGGVMYMTSQGDPGKTKKAKDTILYATIGLIISVLSFAIVNFVIINIIGGNNQSAGSSQTK